MTPTQFAEINFALRAGNLRASVAGDGRPVVHLHSAAGPRRSAVIEKLAQRHRIFCPNLPRFDGSPAISDVSDITNLADLIAEFIATACGGRCDLIGESFGGWVALWVAARHPGCVEQLVVEAPAGLRLAGKGGLPDDPAARLRMLYASPENAPVEARTEMQALANRKATLGYTGGKAFDEALANSLGGIKARTLILMGTQDRVIPAETGHLLKSAIPHSHLIYIAGAAHVLEIDQPERVARLTQDFLDRGESFLVREETSRLSAKA